MERDAATSSTPLMPPTNAPVPYREFEPNGRGLAALTGFLLGLACLLPLALLLLAPATSPFAVYFFLLIIFFLFFFFACGCAAGLGGEYLFLVTSLAQSQMYWASLVIVSLVVSAAGVVVDPDVLASVP